TLADFVGGAPGVVAAPPRILTRLAPGVVEWAPVDGTRKQREELLSMAQVLVTGAAGFVGSHLSEKLLAAGHTVVGVDAFIPYYPRGGKERNLASALAHPAFTCHELALRHADLAPVLEGADIVFHTAAMAGLLKSWQQFEEYMSCNILATQRLLDAAVAANV